MKKNLLISAIVVAVIAATVAVSFAAWDLFKANDSVTFKTGENVELTVSKDTTYTVTDVLVPNKAIKQNANYKYEVALAKGVELKIKGDTTIDTVDYVWDLTKVSVNTASTAIKDIDTFNKYFTIVMRTTDATTQTSTDVALGGKLDITKKYDLIVKFAIDADAQEQKVDADGKKVYINANDSNKEISYTDAEYNALNDKSHLSAAMQDVFGEKFTIGEFKTKDITLEITFEAINRAAN